MASHGQVARQPEEFELLRGDLRHVSLPSLLQLAQAEAISGWIRVRGRGEVALLRGQVGAVTCGPLTGTEALRELAFHDRGHFVLVRGEPGGTRCADNVTFAVMDAYRLRDEWARLAPVVLRRVDDKPWMPTGGHLDRVVLEFDGRRPLAEVLADPPWVVTLVLDALLDALELGLLARVATSRPPVVAAADEDFGELVEEGRRLLRSGALDEAEALLRRALAQRPDDRVVQQNLRALARRRGDEP
jgi:hypothetical protein